MERRSKMLLATALGATIVVVACSFPEVTYRSDDGDAGSESDTGTPTEDTGTDAEPGVEDSGTSDSEPPPLIEAGLPTDGGVVEDASECYGDASGLRKCDCDDDGWMIKDCDPGPDSGLKGDSKHWDCDDLNRDVRPDQDRWFAVPTPDGGWDWNCSGEVEKAYPDGYKCVSLGGALGCSTNVGFEQNKACGEQGPVFRCVANGLLSCANQTQSPSAVQLCH